MKKESFIIIMLSNFQIIKIMLMLISLFFKTDIEIGFKRITIFNTQNNPFYYIPEKEGNIKQFTLLGGMNEFVIKFCRT